jgi:hypothetical protein
MAGNEVGPAANAGGGNVGGQPANAGGANAGGANAGGANAGGANAGGANAGGANAGAANIGGGNVTEKVELTRARTGLLAVVTGDVVIVGASIFGLWKLSGHTAYGSEMVSILTAAFTAVGTLTTAYFGIKSMANTAQYHAAKSNNQGQGNNQTGAQA